uniref:Uncharacterized protein n=1 Tax=Parascaris equorum TaxID=6256 RepID=A0A914S2Z6_PAREQ
FLLTELWAVINNAGVFTTYGPDDWCSIDDYRFSFEVNTLGHIRVSQVLIRRLNSQRKLIWTVSGKAHLVRSGNEFSKVTSLAPIQELKPFGVTCCILEPGVFKTTLIDRVEMKQRIERVWEKLTDEQRQDYGEDFKNFCEDSLTLRRSGFALVFKFGVAVYWSETFNKLGSAHTKYVIDNYYHAITARYPRYRYRCGWDALLLFIPISYLPTAAVDLCLKGTFGQAGQH